MVVARHLRHCSNLVRRSNYALRRMPKLYYSLTAIHSINYRRRDQFEARAMVDYRSVQGLLEAAYADLEQRRDACPNYCTNDAG